MKGADQCPKCGCRKTLDINQPVTDFYARTIRVCHNCKAVWEPFCEADLLDEGDRYSSFKKPCNNCAFRKGSPESEDPIEWQALLDKLGWWDGQFFCHKGVPIEPTSEDGFAYPMKRDGKHDLRRLRFCRGYLNWLNSTQAKAKLVLKLAARSTGP